MDKPDSPNRYNPSQELHHLQSVTSLRVEEIQPILHLLHRDRVLLRAVIQDQLLQVQERPFMRDLLADLHQCLPRVLRRKLRAIRTLPVLHKVLDLEHLLEYRRRQDLLLDRERNAQSFRVWLSPDEVRVGEADLVEALQLFEADSEEFLRFGPRYCPT